MPKYVVGSALAPHVQKEVLRKYSYRYTGDHTPAWLGKVPAKLQFKDDEDWLAHTLFAVRKDGELNKKYSTCESNPTWPENPELRK